MLITNNLYEKILLEPISRGYTDLKIVSGYASAPMVSHHFETIEKNKLEINSIELIVGMAPNDGINISDYQGFIENKRTFYKNQFDCKYIYTPPSVHSKLYIWGNVEGDVEAYVGSANYTQNAFIRKGNEEILSLCDGKTALDYYYGLDARTIYCDHSEVREEFLIYSKEDMLRNSKRKQDELNKGNSKVATTIGSSVILSLVSQRAGGVVPERSGLNWGQRSGRDKNQAYLSIPSSIYRTDFFPPIGETFSLITDDDKTLICVRAQENGKAIHSTQNNSYMGEYFRNRLGLASGEFVIKEHLLEYGRTDVEITKIDEDTYYLNFSPFIANGNN